MSEPQEKQTSQQQAARRIAAMLAQADSFAKLGNNEARDHALTKAAELQHKYAIDQVLLEMNAPQDTEEILFGDFCDEQNTPLVKAKRQLIAGLATLYRGDAVMFSRFDPVKRKVNHRAYIRVYAHSSDLSWITQLYTSLILQLQTEMAKDERLRVAATGKAGLAGWRVSYAHEWVRTVYARLWAIKKRGDLESAGTPGTALALVDKGDRVKEWVKDNLELGKAPKMPTSDTNGAGRAAGRRAGERADLGQKRTAASTTQAIE